MAPPIAWRQIIVFSPSYRCFSRNFWRSDSILDSKIMGNAEKRDLFKTRFSQVSVVSLTTGSCETSSYLDIKYFFSGHNIMSHTLYVWNTYLLLVKVKYFYYIHMYVYIYDVYILYVYMLRDDYRINTSKAMKTSAGTLQFLYGRDRDKLRTLAQDRVRWAHLVAHIAGSIRVKWIQANCTRKTQAVPWSHTPVIRVSADDIVGIQRRVAAVQATQTTHIWRIEVEERNEDE